MSRVKKYHTLNEAYNFSFRINALGGASGVFQQLYTWNETTGHYTIPWLTQAEAKHLDIMYHGGRSGRKWCSPMLEDFLKTYDEDALPYDPVLQAISPMLWEYYGANWTARWNVLQSEYDPIENYSMTENMTDDVTEHTKGATLTRTLNTEHKKTGTDTTTPDTEITAEGYIYGYDSDAATPSDKSVSTTSGTNETEYDTTEADTGTITDVGSGKDTDTRNYELTRKGNIGVTTSQMMITAELELRRYDFFRSVFEDIDKILTLPIY